MDRADTGPGAGDVAAGGSGGEPLDPRVRHAWQAWLSSLATDSEAATAAAHLYGELPGEVRDAWLDALAEDSPEVEVQPLAVYGPLLAVERDPARAERMRKAVGGALGRFDQVKRALIGTAAGGVRVAVLVIPLYLDFVRLLVCRFVKDEGYDWVRQDPFVPSHQAPVSGAVIDGVELFTATTEAIIDELAHAVLAHRRRGREAPKLLRDCCDLFSARLGATTAAGRECHEGRAGG